MQNIYLFDANLDSNEPNSSRKRLKTSTGTAENSYLALPKKNASKKASKQQFSPLVVDHHQSMYEASQMGVSYFYDADMPGCSSSSSSSSSKMQTNEKTRLVSINEAFEILRTHIPTFPYERRLSKIDTLHLAISYINLLESVLESNMNLYDYLSATINNQIQNTSYSNNANNSMCHMMKPCWATSGIYYLYF